MVLLEIGISLLGRETYDRDENHLLQRCELDLIEEKQHSSQLRIASCQRHTTRLFNSKVRQMRFQIEDLVLRRVVKNKGDLDPN